MDMRFSAELAAQEKIHDKSDSLPRLSNVVDEALRVLAFFLHNEPDISCSCFQRTQLYSLLAGFPNILSLSLTLLE